MCGDINIDLVKPENSFNEIIETGVSVDYCRTHAYICDWYAINRFDNIIISDDSFVRSAGALTVDISGH